LGDGSGILEEEGRRGYQMEAKRRRVPRQEAGWPGKCGFEDDPETAWYECMVLDISILGAGLEIYDPDQPILGAEFDPDGTSLIGHRVTVDAHTAGGGSVSIRFTGIIRNVRSGPLGTIRAGVEFLGLSEVERTMLDALERMRIVW
jgi:PilZ domain